MRKTLLDRVTRTARARLTTIARVALLAGVALPASAAVESKAADGFLVKHTFEIAAEPAKATATLIYRVSGDSLHALEGFAPAVDSVLGEQFARWARYASTGKAEAAE